MDAVFISRCSEVKVHLGAISWERRQRSLTSHCCSAQFQTYLWPLTLSMLPPNLCPSFLSSVALALGALTVWQAVLINQGETNIERHINKKEHRWLQAKSRVFRNHYNYGCLDNWKVFLGVDTGR